MITTKENTFSGIWPATRENTYYGYKATDNFYQWYKSKATTIKHLKGTKAEILRATLIKDKMYINHRYLTLKWW